MAPDNIAGPTENSAGLATGAAAADTGRPEPLVIQEQGSFAVGGTELFVAALAGRGLYALDGVGGVLKPVFASGDRFRDVLPVGRDLYVITTNRSPRARGPSEGHRLLRLSPQEGGAATKPHVIDRGEKR